MKLDRTMLWYGLINGFTFAVDLVILTLAHEWLDWPVPLAATVGYAIALSLNFVLNRTFNFRAHGHLGTQAGKFAVAVAVNYTVFILGLVTVLVDLGIEFQIARVAAGLAEAVFLYCAMRFAVFRESREINAAGTPVNPVKTPAE